MFLTRLRIRRILGLAILVPASIASFSLIAFSWSCGCTTKGMLGWLDQFGINIWNREFGPSVFGPGLFGWPWYPPWHLGVAGLFLLGIMLLGLTLLLGFKNAATIGVPSILIFYEVGIYIFQNPWFYSYATLFEGRWFPTLTTS